ncbi:MAG TPA: YgiQ family radical SAM protein [Termitinemataceae bacterium]|nr:YgiQ family radical SAM protein [Termitinemataceae bacterium]HOM23545.1 YgiQ family radical SAM protein [Termitinemataceae bacterium]HPP99664.1 YgiQ family radical SAM protein [Termitinemataceae bacterium]
MKHQKKTSDSRLFLPVSKEDLARRGWEACDFIFVSGDAYVDHPSFAAALIGRVLEAAGFRVGVIPQPRWEDPTSYLALGLPRLAFLVGAGNLDSMVAHYTANRKPRSQDAYSPGGKVGFRPDRATLVYVEGLRRACKLAGEHRPVIIGGIEASLRRFAHYDYWSDRVRRSILLDSKADLLVYGMGERPILEIARRLAQGEPIESIRDVRGTCVWGSGVPQVDPQKVIELPSFEEIREPTAEAKRRFAEHFMLQKRNQDPLSGKILIEKSDTRYVLQNPPALPLATAELDRIYELPFTRQAHPMYASLGGVPALQEVAFSLVSSRGCFGGCSFCAITFHQGRIIQHRSKDSLLREAQRLVQHPDFKGYIHDVGGPTANFFSLPCEVQKRGGVCTHRDCLYPVPCPNLRASHQEYREVLRALRTVPEIKKVFVRSGLRFDYLLLDTPGGPAFLKELCAHHVSGQLKVAPEHITPRVLDAMGKTGSQVYEEFRKLFARANQELGKKQYLIPYFIASHPGSTLEDALELALYLKKTGFVPDQVQDFYPTPGSLATVMYYTGLDPRTMKAIPVPRGERERRLQRALLQFDKKENHPLVREALKQLGKLYLSRTLGLGESRE